MRCIFRDRFAQKLSWLLMKSMKLILIATLLFSACSKAEPDRVSTPANNTVTPTPESGVEAILQNETDRVATLAGLGKWDPLAWEKTMLRCESGSALGCFP